MTPTLSVVIPVFNEREEDLRTTLEALSENLRASPWTDPEIVIVDDGSDAAVVAPPVGGARTRVLSQSNRGRFEARRAGIEAAGGEYVLLLDSRVSLEPGGLAWVAERVNAGQAAWNGHCSIGNLASPFSRFWNVLTHAGFAEYFSSPRTTSFGLEDYDRYPKGTGHFLAPRAWLLEAISEFESRYADTRYSSDDTHLLRAIAARDRIHISPQFASSYRNREALAPFLRHAMHRGTTFFDGFGRPGTRFFPAVLAAFPLSLGGVVLALRRPGLAAAGSAALSAGGAAFALRRDRPQAEVSAFGLLTVPFAAAFSAGIWRGAWFAATHRLKS